MPPPLTKSPAERLAALPAPARTAFLGTLSEAQKADLMHDWRGFLARPSQLAPDEATHGRWAIWMILAGRGFGKTRAGAEWVREKVKAGARRIALVGETAADTRDVMVEGESGILAVHGPHERPLYEPSKRQITWPNGAVAKLYNATEPDQLRGPQHDAAWCDELAKWHYARAAWDQLQFGMRLGAHPQLIVTTTPRPIELVRAIIAGQEGSVVTTRGKTRDNAANLAPGFMEKIATRYAGTRLGRQELDGEILRDTPGALWRAAQIEAHRLDRKALDERNFTRILVSVDPAASDGETSNEHGIIVAGIEQSSGETTGCLIEDGSMRGTPLEWARRAIALHDRFEADGIVVEVNQGGAMVRHTLETVRPHIRIIEVRATRGKHVRAEPVAALYEQGRICHIGRFDTLEEQMGMMTDNGYIGEGSPDRVDAMVWAFSALFPGLIRRAGRGARIDCDPVPVV